jgi:hypothetical protein
MLTISSLPIFTGSLKSDLVNLRTLSTHSSMNVKDHVCSILLWQAFPSHRYLEAQLAQHQTPLNRVIRLNESHTTHACGQVENTVNSFGNSQAIVHNSEIHKTEFIAEHILSHALVLFPIRGNNVVSFRFQSPGNMGGNEPTSSSDGSSLSRFS